MDSSGITFQLAEVDPTAQIVGVFLFIAGLILAAWAIPEIIRAKTAVNKETAILCLGFVLFVAGIFTCIFDNNAEANDRQEALGSLNSQIQEIYGAETDLTAEDIEPLRSQNAEVPALFTRDGEETVVSIQKYNDWIFIKDSGSNLYPTLEERLAEIGAAEEVPAP